MESIERVRVRGGLCVRADLFLDKHLQSLAPLFEQSRLAVMDPPYSRIVKKEWEFKSAAALAEALQRLLNKLGHTMPLGSQVYMWGGFGTPNDRAFYRTIILAETYTPWKMAEHITWRKKRGYGVQWRLLLNREECARFVSGDIRKPLVYNVQYTDELRGYSGFNPDHPAKSDRKRLTMIWDHASDMTKKLHECYKPPPLARSQILASSEEGDTVLDLFGGSAEVSVQSRELGRRFIVVERDKDTFRKIVERLK